MRTEQDCRSRAIKLEQSQIYKDLRLVCSEDLFGTALLPLERRLWKYQPSQIFATLEKLADLYH